MSIAQYLSKEEIKYFRSSSDAHGIWQLIANYAIIAVAFALFCFWPNPISFLLGTFILAGRILGLTVLNHDAGHAAVFKTRSLNRPIAMWLFGGPTLISYDGYRKEHLKHHKLAGTLADPDNALVSAYPASPASMRRKFIRDFSGVNGLKFIVMQLRSAPANLLIPFLAWQILTIGILVAASGTSIGLLAYSMWWLAFLFVFPAIIRLRIMGEHGAVENLIDPDPRRNTRTTLANPIERLLVAPNFVNYHCEHHSLANAPGYKLKGLHNLLRERGYYAEHPYAIEQGYRRIIALCTGSANDTGQLAGSDCTTNQQRRHF